MFGSIIGGWSIDHFGRKGAIMACTVPFELGYLLIAFARNHEMLYAGRVISGVASGMVSLAVPVSLLNAHVNLFAENPKVNGHSPSPPLPSSSINCLSSWNWLLIKNNSIYTLTHPPSSAQIALHHMKLLRSSYLSYGLGKKSVSTMLPNCQHLSYSKTSHPSCIDESPLNSFMLIDWLISFLNKVYIAEIVPARLRGTLGSINQQAITLGLLLCCVMGALVDWRWLAIIGAMPSVFLIIFMLAMPETPRWCLGKNRRTEALAALRWLRGPEADIDQECFAIQETLGENS